MEIQDFVGSHSACDIKWLIQDQSKLKHFVYMKLHCLFLSIFSIFKILYSFTWFYSLFSNFEKLQRQILHESLIDFSACFSFSFSYFVKHFFSLDMQLCLYKNAINNDWKTNGTQQAWKTITLECCFCRGSPCNDWDYDSLLCLCCIYGIYLVYDIIMCEWTMVRYNITERHAWL